MLLLRGAWQWPHIPSVSAVPVAGARFSLADVAKLEADIQNRAAAEVLKWRSELQASYAAREEELSREERRVRVRGVCGVLLAAVAHAHVRVSLPCGVFNTHIHRRSRNSWLRQRSNTPSAWRGLWSWRPSCRCGKRSLRAAFVACLDASCGHRRVVRTQEARTQLQTTKRQAESATGDVDSMQSQLHELRTNAETQRRRADEEHERASDLAVRVKILEVCSTPTCWWMCHELVVVVVVVSCVVVSCE